MKIFRYSGVRLKDDFTYSAQLEMLAHTVLNKAESVFKLSMSEPYLMYDEDKTKTPLQLIINHLHGGELYIAEIDDNPIGYASFRGIAPGRYAYLELYLLPEYRKSTILGEFRDKLYECAFLPFPQGLQLLKLKAHIHPENKSSISACENSGFKIISLLPFEGLFNKQISPMLLLELYPKEVLNSMQGEEINVSSQSTSDDESSPRKYVHSGKRRRSRKQSAELPEHKQ